MDKNFDWNSVRPKGERIGPEGNSQSPIDTIQNLDAIANTILPTRSYRGMQITDEQLRIAAAPRRGARFHTLDITHPDTIRLINEEFAHPRSGYHITITKEFIDAYLAESEANDGVPTWQPMADGSPIGEKVSAKELYAKLGGTLCSEIALPSPKGNAQ